MVPSNCNCRKVGFPLFAHDQLVRTKKWLKTQNNQSCQKIGSKTLIYWPRQKKLTKKHKKIGHYQIFGLKNQNEKPHERGPVSSGARVLHDHGKWWFQSLTSHWSKIVISIPHQSQFQMVIGPIINHITMHLSTKFCLLYF